MRRVMTALVALIAFSGVVSADGLPRQQQQRIGAPYQPAADEWKGAIEAGLLAGYGWTDGSDNFVGGGYIGYSARRGWLQLGIEADLTNNPTGTIRFNREEFQNFDNWLATLRVKGGAYIVTDLLAYGTAGVAFEDGDQGLVWGAGLQYNIPNTKWNVRGELLRYELDGGQLNARVGLGVTF